MLRTHFTSSYVAYVHARFAVDVPDTLRVVVILDAVSRNIFMDDIAGGRVNAEVLTCHVLPPRGQNHGCDFSYLSWADKGKGDVHFKNGGHTNLAKPPAIILSISIKAGQPGSQRHQVFAAIDRIVSEVIKHSAIVPGQPDFPFLTGASVA